MIEAVSSTNTSPFPVEGLLAKAAAGQNGPQAYLNYLVFDENLVLLEEQSGYIPLTQAAKEDGSNVPHEQLSKEIIVKQPGYVYIYLSNDNPEPMEVYFDDFTVTHAHSAIVQSDDYYPFGLRFNQYKAPGKMSNKLLFNDSSRLEEATGLYETYFRNYDPSIGRFNGVDMLAAMTPSLTPYRYGFNNPVSYNDPTGLSERPNACRDCEDGGGGGFFDSSNPFGDGGTSTWDWGGGNNWMDQYSSQNRDYFLMSGPAFEKKWGQGLSDYRNSLILQKAHQTGNANTYINSGYYSYTSTNGGKTWQNTGWTEGWTVAQNGGVGWEAWAGTTGVYSWGLREFYYGPRVRGLSQYYGQSEAIRLNASRTRNAITARTQSLTPQPLRSIAQGTKVWQVNPNGNFAKPNAGAMWKMRGVGVGGGLLLGYGIYNSATNISNASTHGYGTEAAINEGFSWAGAIAGGIAGAEGGAYVGGVIGVWFGGAGAVPGAAIGGFIGGLGGSIVGGAAGYWTGSNITGY